MPTPSPAGEARHAAERRGRRAETIAAWYLRLKGYGVLARRFRGPIGEIDLVARWGTVIFVEVKARSGDESGLEAVGPKARARISARRGGVADALSRGRGHEAAVRCHRDPAGLWLAASPSQRIRQRRANVAAPLRLLPSLRQPRISQHRRRMNEPLNRRANGPYCRHLDRRRFHLCVDA